MRKIKSVETAKSAPSRAAAPPPTATATAVISIFPTKYFKNGWFQKFSLLRREGES